MNRKAEPATFEYALTPISGDRLELMARVASFSQSGSTSSEDLSDICNLIASAMGASGCVVRILEGDALVLHGSGGTHTANLSERIYARQGPGDLMIRTRKPIAIADVENHVDMMQLASQSGGLGFKSYAGAPMLAGDRVVGILGIFEDSNIVQLDRTDLAYLQIIANHLAVVFENKRLVDELVRLNLDLDSRVNERTSELLAAKERFEEFSYRVAHDLKSPLRNIVSMANILVEDYSEMLSGDAMNILHTQIRAGSQLMFLINDLLEFAASDQSVLKFEWLNLSNIAEEVADNLVNQGSAEVSVTVHPGIRVCADERLIRLLLQNLMENAIKFSGHNVKADVTIGQDGDGRFFIKDNGIGFNMCDAERIFRPFERLKSALDVPGHGIGLSTAARIVGAHGGRIWAESEPGVGTTFRFTLGKHNGCLEPMVNAAFGA